MVLAAGRLTDGDDLARRWRRVLDVDRRWARLLGEQAVEAIETGRYLRADGSAVAWAPLVEAAVRARVSIAPDASLPDPPGPRWPTTQVTVANESTLAAARRLVDGGRATVLALNMANGVSPGGGFLRGARAQEESLCRASALYATLRGDPMYAAHARRGDHESSDWAILSPDVPVFRTDDGTPLDEPWLCSFLTCAAPYAPKVRQPRSADLLAARMERALAVAHAYGYDTLVLGAWGCGAFGNDPDRLAADLHRSLTGRYDGAFAEIVLAITDWSPERRNLGPFRDRFCGTGSG